MKEEEVQEVVQLRIVEINEGHKKDDAEGSSEQEKRAFGIWE